MVMGGLLRNEETKTITKLPFLGDLPVIGAAFRNKNSSKSERELIIFITPHILNDHNQDILKLGNSPQESATSMADAVGRIEEVDQTLNSYELKRN